MNAGRTVFAQLMDLLPRRAFESAVERYDGRARPCRLSSMDQLLCMAFAQLTGRASLRETVTCPRALGPRRYHCGIRTRPARSTLAEANERRDHRIYSDTAMAMVAAARLDLPVDPDLRRLGIAAAFAIDSTTIDLCLKLFPWAHFRRRKAGVPFDCAQGEAHVMLDLRFGIPAFMRVTDAKTSDVSVLDHIVRPAPSTSSTAGTSTSPGCTASTRPGRSSSPGPSAGWTSASASAWPSRPAGRSRTTR